MGAGTVTWVLLLTACFPANGDGQRQAGTPATTSTQRARPTMRISFERSGGVAGMRLAVTFDTDTLSEAEANELGKLVGDARFFDQPQHPTRPGPGADQFHYSLTVEAEGRRRTVETDDGAAPAELRPLLDWLVRFARRQRGGPR